MQFIFEFLTAMQSFMEKIKINNLEGNVNFFTFLNSSEIPFPRMWSVFGRRGLGFLFCVLELY